MGFVLSRKNSQSYLEDSHIEKIATTYHSFISTEGFSAVASIDQILENDGKLSIALYVRGTEEEAPEQVTVDDAIADWLSSSGRVYDNYNTLCNMITGA